MNEEDLLKLNNKIVKGWKFVTDSENEGFKLIKEKAIESEDGLEDEWVATIYDMDTFFEWLKAIK